MSAEILDRAIEVGSNVMSKYHSEDDLCLRVVWLRTFIMGLEHSSPRVDESAPLPPIPTTDLGGVDAWEVILL